MIYTLTLNPAVDYVLHLDELEKGTIRRSDSESIFFGGKGINVSVVLKELGVRSRALGFLAGFTGRGIADGLNEQGIENDFVFSEHGVTRINVKIRAKEETDLNGRGPSVSEKDLRALTDKLDRLQDGDVLVLSGSVPPSLPKDIYKRILARFAKKDVRCCVDASGELLVNALSQHPFLIKPNAEELSEILGEEITTREEALRGAKRLQELGARNVLVSMGENGAVLLEENGTAHQRDAFSGTVVNTAGAGDSLLAGFLAGYEQTKDPAYALLLGVAAGSATAFGEGLAKQEEIEAVLNASHR